MGLIRKVGVLLLVVIVIGGSIGGAYYMGFLGKPSAGLEDRGDWGEVTDKHTKIITTFWVNNPNPLGISVGGNVQASFELYLNGVNLAQGSKEGISIEPGNNTLRLKTELNNQRLPAWWVAFIQNNETIHLRAVPSATVEAGPFTVSPDLPEENRTLLEDKTPIIGALSSVTSAAEGRYTENISAEDLRNRIDQDLPGNQLTSKEFEVGYVVKKGWATWGKVSKETTVVKFHFLVKNPSEELCMPAEPENLGLTVNMNNVEMFKAQGDDTSLQDRGNFSLNDNEACKRDIAHDRPVLAPQETKEVVYIVQMDNDKIDEWFTSHVKRSEQTEVRTELQLVFSAVGTTFRLPEDSPATYTCSFQTNIFVDDQNITTNCAQPESITGVEASGTTDDNDQSGDSTPTEGDDTSTATTQSTSTRTQTPTTTETPTETSTPSPPTARAEANKTEGEAPLTVSFDASKSTDPDGDIKRYVWRFGDGSAPKEGKTVTHTYRTAGEYTVQLTVIDSEGNRDTTTITITVKPRGP